MVTRWSVMHPYIVCAQHGFDVHTVWVQKYDIPFETQLFQIRIIHGYRWFKQFESIGI